MAKGDLTPYSVPSFQGGVNDFAALFGGMQEDESLELRNAVMDGVGRLNFRRGTRIRQILQDEGSNEVDHVIGIWAFGTGTLALAWSDTYDKVYVYTSSAQDGSGFVRKADLHTSVTSAPRIKAQEISAGGGGTGSPDSTWPSGRRMYFVDPEGNLPLKFYAQSDETVYTVQRDFGSGLVSLYPRAIAEFNYHLMTGGYQDDDYTGVEVVRYSTPGLVASDDENDGASSDTFEWWLLDREAVGRPGEAVIAMGKAGGGLVILKENNVHYWHGYDRETWGQRHINGQFGAVSPDAVEANSWLYYMSQFGPCRTNGQGIEFIGDKIRGFISHIGDPAATVIVHNPLKFQVAYFFVWPDEDENYPTRGKAFSYLTNGWTDVDIFSAIGSYVTVFGGGVVGTTSLPAPDGAPSNLAVSKTFLGIKCSDKFTLTWDNSDTNPGTVLKVYEIESATAPLDADWNTASPIVELVAGVDEYSLQKLLATEGFGTQFWYQVRYERNGQESNWNGDTLNPATTDVGITTSAAPTAPQDPTGLTATDVKYCSGGSPQYYEELEWTNNHAAHPDADSIWAEIEGRITIGSTWENVDTVPIYHFATGVPATTTITVLNPNNGSDMTTYDQWRVRLINKKTGCSSYKYSSYAGPAWSAISKNPCTGLDFPV